MITAPIVSGNIKISYNGQSGKELVKSLAMAGYSLGDFTREIISALGPNFMERGIYTVGFVGQSNLEGVILGEEAVRVKARRRFAYFTPHIGIAPLLRLAMTDNDLRARGLSKILVMHDSILDPEGYSSVLSLGYDIISGRLACCRTETIVSLPARGLGFVFLKPEQPWQFPDEESYFDTP